MPFDPQVSGLQGPISTSSTPGGGGVLPRLFSFVNRAMAVAQLTNLHISISASEVPTGEVPEECFPRGLPSRGLTDPRRVSFTSGVTVLGDNPPLEQAPDVVEDDDMDGVEAVLDVPVPVFRPPPGVENFSWPREEWGPNGDPSLFDFSRELPVWFPCQYRGQSVDPPSLPISPVLRDSLDDSVAANVGSSREESNTSEAVVAAPTVVDAFPVGMVSGPDVMVDAVTDLPKCLTGHVSRRSPGLSLAGGWLGRAPFLRNVRPHQSVVWVLDAHFATRPTVLRTMRRHLASLAFHCTIPDSWNGLAYRSRRACWDQGGGCIRCLGTRLWMRLSSSIGMFV